MCPHLNQRLPILPGGLPPSTFGVCRLNCCVRHGNRWIPTAIATELFTSQDFVSWQLHKKYLFLTFLLLLEICSEIPSPTLNFSFFTYHTFLYSCSWAFRVSDSVSFARRFRSFKTASLLKSSPRSISTGPLHTSLCFHSRPIYHVVFMGPYLLLMRNLIFRLVSRLDAFSVYPSRT